MTASAAMVLPERSPDQAKFVVNSDSLAALQYEAMREICRRAKVAADAGDVLAWGKLIFPDKFSLPYCYPLHGYFVEIMEADLTDTEAPRNHAKTAVKCNLIPMFLSIHKPQIYKHYLNVQATEEKGLAVNRTIKMEFELNQLLRLYCRVYFDAIAGQCQGERWTDAQFVLWNGVVFTAIGAGQSVRGINYRSRRPDYIIVDDLYNEEDITNLDSTRKKNTWFWSSLYPARAKGKKCCVHVQGTAINQEDLLFKLQGRERWHHRVFRAVLDFALKTVLWPELNTFDSLMADKIDMGTLIWSREMQNERMDEAESVVRRAWLENWEYDPLDLKFNAELQLLTVRLGGDPSIGEGLESDATGYAVVLKCRRKDEKFPDYYIHALVNKRMTLQERIAKINELAAGMPPKLRIRQARIEGISGFADFAAEVKRRCSMAVEIIKKTPDKLTHLINKSVLFENGRVHLNKNIATELKDMLKEQLTLNYPTHDDLRDALLLALDTKTAGWGFVG